MPKQSNLQKEQILVRDWIVGGSIPAERPSVSPARFGEAYTRLRPRSEEDDETPLVEKRVMELAVVGLSRDVIKKIIASEGPYSSKFQLATRVGQGLHFFTLYGKAIASTINGAREALASQLKDVDDRGRRQGSTGDRRDPVAQKHFERNAEIDYDNKCACCLMSDPKGHVAAHIVGWKAGQDAGLTGLFHRGNALLLCGTCDKLFGTQAGSLILVEDSGRLFWYYTGPDESYRAREGQEFIPPAGLLEEIIYNLQRRKDLTTAIKQSKVCRGGNNFATTNLGRNAESDQSVGRLGERLLDNPRAPEPVKQTRKRASRVPVGQEHFSFGSEDGERPLPYAGQAV